MPSDKKGKKVEPGIWELLDGKGYIAEVSWIDPESGLRIWEMKTTNRKDGAQKWRNKRKTEAMMGEITRKKKRQVITFEKFAGLYLRAWGSKRKPSTVKAEANRLNGILIPYFGNRAIHTITRRDIEIYLQRRHEGGIPWVATKRRNKRTGGVVQATTNRELCRLKNMYRYATNWGYVDVNPAGDIKQEREVVEEKPFLTKEEVASLLDKCEPHIACLLTVAVNTGMRWGELMALQWKDVRFDRKLITVSKSKNDETRHVPMNSATSSSLSSHRKQQAKDIGGLVTFVFENPDTGNPYIDVSKALRESLKKAEIDKHITFHGLRHTAASNMVMSGINFETVGKILGHRDPKMTKRYTHLAPDYLQDAIGKLDYTVDVEATEEVAQADR